MTRVHVRVHVNTIQIIDLALGEARAWRWRYVPQMGHWSWRTEFVTWESDL